MATDIFPPPYSSVGDALCALTGHFGTWDRMATALATVPPFRLDALDWREMEPRAGAAAESAPQATRRKPVRRETQPRPVVRGSVTIPALAGPTLPPNETADRLATWGRPLSVTELIEVTGLNRKKVYSMVRRGTIRFQDTDCMIQFDPATIAEWWRSRAR